MKIIEHKIIFKQKGIYASFPILKYIDNQLTIGFFKAPKIDHCGLFEWAEGNYYDKDSRINYLNEYRYAENPRQNSDTFIYGDKAIGATAFNKYKREGKKDLEKVGIKTFEVGYILYALSSKLFFKRMLDSEAIKKTIAIPNVKYILTFPRVLKCNDLILVPAYTLTDDNKHQCFLIRSEDDGFSWNFYNMFPSNIDGNEMAFIDIDDKLYCMIRNEKNPYLMESWSYDKGLTWTYPVYTNINGTPPHLLKLKDGRILLTYGYRYDAMGIRAKVSKIIFRNEIAWSEEFILRDDSGYPSEFHKKKKDIKNDNGAMHVGYPVSVQLNNGNILTAYYITCKDRITHIATTEWSIE